MENKSVVEIRGSYEIPWGLIDNDITSNYEGTTSMVTSITWMYPDFLVNFLEKNTQNLRAATWAYELKP